MAKRRKGSSSYSLHDKDRLAVQVAERYYINGELQKEIANRFGLDSSTVSRLLRYAREKGIVQIAVKEPDTAIVRDTDLEQSLVTYIPELQDAVVVKFPYSDKYAPGEDYELHRTLGRALADRLRMEITTNQHIGVCGGRGVFFTAQALQTSTIPLRQTDVTITALAGRVYKRGLRSSDRAPFHFFDADDAVFTFATAFPRSKPRPVTVPAIVLSPQMVEELVERGPAQAISRRKWDQDRTNFVPDVAIIGIGTLAGDHRFLDIGAECFELAPVAEDLRKLGGFIQRFTSIAGYCPVGDLAYRLFCAALCEEIPLEESEKNEISKLIGEINEKIVAVTFDQLREVRKVIAIAGGPLKHHAIWTVLTDPKLSGIVHELCTDAETARWLLQRAT